MRENQGVQGRCTHKSWGVKSPTFLHRGTEGFKNSWQLIPMCILHCKLNPNPNTCLTPIIATPPLVLLSDMAYDPECTTGHSQREPPTLSTVILSLECCIRAYTDKLLTIPVMFYPISKCVLSFFFIKRLLIDWLVSLITYHVTKLLLYKKVNPVNK